MTTKEFSDAFDTLLNSYNNLSIFGEASSRADITLDEYEKSIFLTLAQDLIIKLYFERTSANLGFDENERRQIDFSSLIRVAKPDRYTDGSSEWTIDTGYAANMPMSILGIGNAYLYLKLNINFLPKNAEVSNIKQVEKIHHLGGIVMNANIPYGMSPKTFYTNNSTAFIIDMSGSVNNEGSSTPNPPGSNSGIDTPITPPQGSGLLDYTNTSIYPNKNELNLLSGYGIIVESNLITQHYSANPIAYEIIEGDSSKVKIIVRVTINNPNASILRAWWETRPIVGSEILTSSPGIPVHEYEILDYDNHIVSFIAEKNTCYSADFEVNLSEPLNVADKDTLNLKRSTASIGETVYNTICGVPYTSNNSSVITVDFEKFLPSVQTQEDDIWTSDNTLMRIGKLYLRLKHSLTGIDPKKYVLIKYTDADNTIYDAYPSFYDPELLVLDNVLIFSEDAPEGIPSYSDESNIHGKITISISDTPKNSINSTQVLSFSSRSVSTANYIRTVSESANSITISNLYTEGSNNYASIFSIDSPIGTDDLRSETITYSIISNRGAGASYDERGILYKLPTTLNGNPSILFVLNEKLLVTKRDNSLSNTGNVNVTKTYVVKPISYREYDREMSKAYSLPLKKLCWRLFLNSTGIDIVSEIIPTVGTTINTNFEYRIRYVERPTPIVLTTLPEDLEIDGYRDVTECSLNPILHMDILNKAVELVLSTRAGRSALAQHNTATKQQD